jgi:integrase
MDKSHVIDKHLEFKRISIKNEPKLKDIKRMLERFVNSSKKPLNKFNEEDLIKFINSLTKKYSIRTINDTKVYLKVFIKWYYSDFSSRFRNLDKLCKMQQPSKAYTPEQMVSFEEVKKLVANENDLMYKVFWLVFFYGGFRPSECAGLRWDQVYFEKEGVIIKLHTTKTNKDFYKSLPPEAEHLLKEWKQYNHSELLFPSPLKENQPIRARSICGRLKRLSKKTLGYEVVPYAMRHSIATILYKDDLRKDDITAHQLGHNKSMKAVYMNLNSEEIKAKARNLWIKTKPLTADERNELEKLKTEVSNLKQNMNKEIIEQVKKVIKLTFEEMNKDLKKV